MRCGSTHGVPYNDGMEVWRGSRWADSCLAHEELHWAQFRIDGEADAEHAKWTERGFYDAIRDARESLLDAGM